MKQMISLSKKVLVIVAMVCFSVTSISAVSLAGQSAEAVKGAAEQKVTKKVNVNAAEPQELMALPGIGQKTAENIVAHRKSFGPFKKSEDLLKVKGIGEKNLKKIADLISFE